MLLIFYITLRAFTEKKLDVSYFRCEERTSKVNKISTGAVLSWVGFFGVIPLAIAVDVMGSMIAGAHPIFLQQIDTEVANTFS